MNREFSRFILGYYNEVFFGKIFFFNSADSFISILKIDEFFVHLILDLLNCFCIFIFCLFL